MGGNVTPPLQKKQPVRGAASRLYLPSYRLSVRLGGDRGDTPYANTTKKSGYTLGKCSYTRPLDNDVGLI